MGKYGCFVLLMLVLMKIAPTLFWIFLVVAFIGGMARERDS